MARFATGRQGVVCTDATYHGNSELVGSLTRLRDGRPANPDVRAFPFPQTLRPVVPGLTGEALASAYLERLDQAITQLEASGAGLAALIVCPIFANEGLPDVPPGFMARAAARIRAAGGLVIADEVQAGYGRCGQWWGYGAAGFAPDIAVTGKPMGAGLPLAATAASRALVETFRERTRYFNTFASSPLQAAVGLAVLDVIEEENLIAGAAAVGAGLKHALTVRKARWGAIGDVRGVGLFIGVEMVDGAGDPDPALAVELVNRLKHKGVLTGAAGAFGNVVKIRPPLVFGEPHAAAFLEAFDTVADELESAAVG
jgi:4-aminobutyrate aminotransferase-like enzyme